MRYRTVILALAVLAGSACSADVTAPSDPLAGSPSAHLNVTVEGDDVPVIATHGPVVTSEVEVVDLIVGTGAEVDGPGVLVADYVGTFTDGTVFDSSYERSDPLEVPVGVGAVIAAWDEGLTGMRAGGRRLIVAPADKAYGADGYAGVIPGGETLLFVVDARDFQRS